MTSFKVVDIGQNKTANLTRRFRIRQNNRFGENPANNPTTNNHKKIILWQQARNTNSFSSPSTLHFPRTTYKNNTFIIIIFEAPLFPTVHYVIPQRSACSISILKAAICKSQVPQFNYSMVYFKRVYLCISLGQWSAIITKDVYFCWGRIPTLEFVAPDGLALVYVGRQGWLISGLVFDEKLEKILFSWNKNFEVYQGYHYQSD